MDRSPSGGGNDKEIDRCTMTNNTMRFTSFIIALVVWTSAATAQHITIRLSYKAVLNPTNGLRSLGATDAEVAAAVMEMNDFSAAYWRGFKFVLAEPVRNIGGIGDTTGPSFWYSADLPAGNNMSTFEAAAKADPRYLWRTDAINIYLLDGFSGGNCSYPTRGELVVLGHGAAPMGELLLHELGHYFNLCHTHGCECTDCVGGGFPCRGTPSTDGVADTLPDVGCWGKNDISTNAFGLPFAGLSPSQQKQVDDTYHNIMSYHPKPEQYQLTELQLDQWTDAANSTRRPGTSGRTWFVDALACTNPTGGSVCGSVSGGPFSSIHPAYTAANPGGGDILMVRPGLYPDRGTFNKPVTLRATRQGPVTIGY